LGGIVVGAGFDVVVGGWIHFFGDFCCAEIGWVSIFS
jgi:hypothetical protein